MNKLVFVFLLVVAAVCLAVPTPGEGSEIEKREVVMYKYSNPIYRSYLPYGYRSYLGGSYYEPAAGGYVYPRSPYYVV